MFRSVTAAAYAILALLMLTLLCGHPRPVAGQDAERKQTLVIGYPTTGIVIDGRPTKYTGIIYVKVYPVSPDLVRKYGAGPMASAELTASRRDVRMLPLGQYEVHFSMRSGNELKTYILRDVILRADRADTLTVQMSGDAKTTIIGGDMTAQQMADSIRQMQAEIASLKREIVDLKRK